MGGASAEAKAEIDKVLEPIALKSKAAAKAKGEDPSMLFITGKEEGNIAGQVRKLCKLDATAGAKPMMLMLDIPDDGGFYVSDATEITESAVKAFIQGYTDKTLTRQQL